MNWELVRLSVGAFLTSAGAAAIAALVAAMLAYRGIVRRIEYDRKAATAADTRERWWQAYTHLWDHRAEIPTAALLNGVASLSDIAETEQQTVMLDLLLASTEDAVEEDIDG